MHLIKSTKNHCRKKNNIGVPIRPTLLRESAHTDKIIKIKIKIKLSNKNKI
jgi:hypothetical protein